MAWVGDPTHLLFARSSMKPLQAAVSLSVATLAALDELLIPEDAALHVSNRSQDRAVPQATLGDREAEVLSLHELGRCPALRRCG